MRNGDDHAVPSDAAFRAWLKEANLDSAYVARLLGVRPPVISRLGRTINGRTYFPTDDQQFQIAQMSGGRVMPNDWFANLPEPDPVEIEFTGDELNRMLRNGDTIRRKKGKLRIISRARSIITALVAAGVALSVWQGNKPHGMHWFDPYYEHEPSGAPHIIHARNDRFPTDLYGKIRGGGGLATMAEA